MQDRFERTELLYGREAMNKLRKSKVAVFGLGGVGSYVVEALARSGIGALELVDHDRVDISNFNRQIIATEKTLGMYKADAAAARVAEISPDCRVTVQKTFFLPDTADQFDFRSYDYVVDAIDTVSGKLAIITQAKAAGVPVISAMGAGNKRDPSAFEVADLYATSVCPLAKVMRHECRKRGIEALKVVYSKEVPLQPMAAEQTVSAVPEESSAAQLIKEENDRTFKKRIPGSVAFVPSVAGLIIAGEVINDLTGV